MTKRKIIIIEVIATFIVLFLAKAYTCNFSINRIFYADFLIFILLFSVFILIIALIPAFLISSLIRGQYTKTYFQDFLKWTIPTAILFGLYLQYTWQMNFKYSYRQDNVEHNEIYKNFYRDNRDECIKLAISKVESQIENKGDYRILRMRVLEKDTIINDKIEHAFDIHQIYCIGKQYETDNKYFARHFVFDKKVNEININVPTSSFVVKEQVAIIDTLTNRLLYRPQTLDSVTQTASNFVEGAIKLRE